MRELLFVREQRVLIDSDLARLYGVSTKALNQAVKRNLQRFPPDFMFRLTATEKRDVVTSCDHLSRIRFSPVLPFAFTEHGAIQAANVINSIAAIEMSVVVVRAFVHLRQMIISNKELALRLDDLESKSMLMAAKQESFEQNTRTQLKQLFDALRELMAAPAPPPKRPIGFVPPADRSSESGTRKISK